MPNWKPQINPQIYIAKRQLLLKYHGSLPIDDFSSTVALKNTLIQARSLALSSDRKTVIDATDLDIRAAVFCEILENLRVDGSSEKPILYKPAMLACVIEAIESGELEKNEISFDFIAPKFIEKMLALGETVSETQVAHPRRGEPACADHRVE